MQLNQTGTGYAEQMVVYAMSLIFLMNVMIFATSPLLLAMLMVNITEVASQV